jgi:quercetin 2,3-dioxygenase
LLQIWILPDRKGIEPSYEQKNFTKADKLGKLRLVGSHDGRDGSVVIHQDINLYAAALPAGESVSYTFAPGRVGWLQVTRGSVKLNEHQLKAGDGVAIDRETNIEIQGIDRDTEVLLFDMVA